MSGATARSSANNDASVSAPDISVETRLDHDRRWLGADSGAPTLRKTGSGSTPRPVSVQRGTDMLSHSDHSIWIHPWNVIVPSVLMFARSSVRSVIDILPCLKTRESHGTAPLDWDITVYSLLPLPEVGILERDREGRLRTVPTSRYSYLRTTARKTRSYFLC